MDNGDFIRIFRTAEQFSEQNNIKIVFVNTGNPTSTHWISWFYWHWIPNHHKVYGDPGVSHHWIRFDEYNIKFMQIRTETGSPHHHLFPNLKNSNVLLTLAVPDNLSLTNVCSCILTPIHFLIVWIYGQPLPAGTARGGRQPPSIRPLWCGVKVHVWVWELGIRSMLSAHSVVIGLVDILQKLMFVPVPHVVSVTPMHSALLALVTGGHGGAYWR